MEEKNEIEMDITDAILEKPYGFTAGEKRFYLYPITLGKSKYLAPHVRELHLEPSIVAKSPYAAAIDAVKKNRLEVLHIIATHTVKSKDELFDTEFLTQRIDDLSNECTDDDLTTLLVLCLTKDSKTEKFLKHFGIDEDRQRMKIVCNAKEESKNSYSFGGLSIYGTLIDVACERYGWPLDYVVWGISYINLQMLMADHVTTIHLTDDEAKKVHVAHSNSDNIDANNPENEDAMKIALGLK